MKSLEDQKQVGYPKSFIQTRSRRKKSLRLEDMNVNAHNGVILDSIYSTQDFDQENEMNDEDLLSILNDFTCFISDINLNDVDVSLSKNLPAEPQPEKYLKKRSNEMINSDENNEYIPRRSSRIKQMQINKNKRKKRKLKEAKNQNTELGVIDEENFIHDEKKTTPKTNPQDNTNMDDNQDMTEYKEPIKNTNLKQNKKFKESKNQKLKDNDNSKLTESSKQVIKMDNQSQGNSKFHQKSYLLFSFYIFINFYL